MKKVALADEVYTDTKWNLQGEKIERKFEVMISNVEQMLAEVYLKFTDIIDIKLCLTDLDELPTLNKMDGDYFEHLMSTRTSNIATPYT